MKGDHKNSDNQMIANNREGSGNRYIHRNKYALNTKYNMLQQQSIFSCFILKVARLKSRQVQNFRSTLEIFVSSVIVSRLIQA